MSSRSKRKNTRRHKTLVERKQMATHYIACDDLSQSLKHHGIQGQKWGVQNGPPYPLEPGDHSAAEKRENAGKYGISSSAAGGPPTGPKEGIDKKKLAIGIGATIGAVAVIGGVTAGAVYYSKNKEQCNASLNSIKTEFLNNPNIKSITNNIEANRAYRAEEKRIKERDDSIRKGIEEGKNDILAKYKTEEDFYKLLSNPRIARTAKVMEVIAKDMDSKGLKYNTVSAKVMSDRQIKAKLTKQNQDANKELNKSKSFKAVEKVGEKTGNVTDIVRKVVKPVNDVNNAKNTLLGGITAGVGLVAAGKSLYGYVKNKAGKEPAGKKATLKDEEKKNNK